MDPIASCLMPALNRLYDEHSPVGMTMKKIIGRLPGSRLLGKDTEDRRTAAGHEDSGRTAGGKFLLDLGDKRVAAYRYPLQIVVQEPDDPPNRSGKPRQFSLYYF